MKRELRLTFSAEEGSAAEEDGRRETVRIFRRLLEEHAARSEPEPVLDEKKTG